MSIWFICLYIQYDFLAFILPVAVVTWILKPGTNTAVIFWWVLPSSNITYRYHHVRLLHLKNTIYNLITWAFFLAKTWHIETETKWMPFCRWHFKCICLHQCLILYWYLTVVCSCYRSRQSLFRELSWFSWCYQMETFSRYWPFVRGIHRSTVNSPQKGQWHGALMFSLICAWMNGWVNTREAGD